MDIRMESMKVASLRGDIALNPPPFKVLLRKCFQTRRSPFTFNLLVLIERLLRVVLGGGFYFVCSHDEEILCAMSGGWCEEGRKKEYISFVITIS